MASSKRTSSTSPKPKQPAPGPAASARAAKSIASPAGKATVKRGGKSISNSPAVRPDFASGAGLASLCAAFADDKKAGDIVVLDVRGLASFADYLVVCAGSSEPHLRAIASGIEDSMRKDFHLRPYRSDGIPASNWVVLDFVDVVVHIFREETRSYYGIEDLWSDARRVEWQPLARQLIEGE